MPFSSERKKGDLPIRGELFLNTVLCVIQCRGTEISLTVFPGSVSLTPLPCIFLLPRVKMYFSSPKYRFIQLNVLFPAALPLCLLLPCLHKSTETFHHTHSVTHACTCKEQRCAQTGAHTRTQPSSSVCLAMSYAPRRRAVASERYWYSVP